MTVVGPAGTSTAGIIQLSSTDDIGPGEGVTWRVEFSYYANPPGVAEWGTAQWGNDDWASGAPFPTNVANKVISINISRGRDEPLARFSPGACTVLIDDPFGELSPWAAVPPDDFGPIRPGIKLQVIATYQGIDCTRFTGFVSAIVDTFPDIIAGGHAIQVTAYDGMSDLARFDGLPLDVAVGTNELAGARLDRIVTNANYAGATNFDTGTVQLQATTLEGNALELAGLVADTELGAFFADRDNVLVFIDRNGMGTEPHFTDVQYGFGEQVGELCYSDIELVVNQDRIRNRVTISNVDGTPVTHDDADSIALYRTRTYERTDLIHSNGANSGDIADVYLDVFANAVRRVESLTILPSVLDGTIQAALDIDLLWRIQVRRRATGFEVLTELQVEAYEENVLPNEWSVAYKVYSSTAGGGLPPAIATWNTAVWDTDLWGF